MLVACCCCFFVHPSVDFSKPRAVKIKWIEAPLLMMIVVELGLEEIGIWVDSQKYPEDLAVYLYTSKDIVQTAHAVNI